MPISIVKFLFKHDYQNNVEQHFSLAYYSLFPCLCLSLFPCLSYSLSPALSQSFCLFIPLPLSPFSLFSLPSSVCSLYHLSSLPEIAVLQF